MDERNIDPKWARQVKRGQFFSPLLSKRCSWWFNTRTYFCTLNKVFQLVQIIVLLFLFIGKVYFTWKDVMLMFKKKLLIRPSLVLKCHLFWTMWIKEIVSILSMCFIYPSLHELGVGAQWSPVALHKITVPVKVPYSPSFQSFLKSWYVFPLHLHQHCGQFLPAYGCYIV